MLVLMTSNFSKPNFYHFKCTQNPFYLELPIHVYGGKKVIVYASACDILI